MNQSSSSGADMAVLVVGAGPVGLTLAAGRPEREDYEYNRTR